jgi:hypothetical protein
MLNMYCLRSTPTESPVVVLTAWQPATSNAAVTPQRAKILRISYLH